MPFVVALIYGSLEHMKFLKEHRIIITIVAIILILVVGIFAFAEYSSRMKGEMTSFTVSLQDGFVVKGKQLSNVEVWIVPTGTNIQLEDHQLLMTLNLENHDNDHQIWTGKIPLQPVLAAQIYVQGFDNNDRLVGQLSLPYNGATEIYNALWATTTHSSIKK
jgi:hypothetical protein